MRYDGQNPMSLVLNFIRTVFVWCIDTLDSIYLLGNFSMLDFSVALLVMGAILPIVIKSVSNYTATADGLAVNEYKKGSDKK